MFVFDEVVSIREVISPRLAGQPVTFEGLRLPQCNLSCRAARWVSYKRYQYTILPVYMAQRAICSAYDGCIVTAATVALLRC